MAMEEMLWNNVQVDKEGGIYTNDGKCLLKCPDVTRYRIMEGCESVDVKAFVGCKHLESLYVPYTFTEEAFDAIFETDCEDNEFGYICHWNKPYVEEVYDDNDNWCDENQLITDEHGVTYANEGRRLIRAERGFNLSEYEVPDGVVTICSFAFIGCPNFLELSVPRKSIQVIGDDIFGQESGRIVIRD